ncbi:hypothetical protein GUJ93_ZPchr0006g45317 [Zizania palustris]|uniref:Uncharacterized protein n=1 Tax=Zizania palustris TaxID=103762 RepID=A0A8J5SM61_ZIZPA|nr:hypothetical protein GUJ93_ZPchr0006g45317 [Zizania palustris]
MNSNLTPASGAKVTGEEKVITGFGKLEWAKRTIEIAANWEKVFTGKEICCVQSVVEQKPIEELKPVGATAAPEPSEDRRRVGMAESRGVKNTRSELAMAPNVIPGIKGAGVRSN